MLDDFFKSEALSLEASQQFSGCYSAELNGEKCKLDINTQPNKVFRGSLNCNGQNFELKGKLNAKTQTYYGFLIDPVDQLPFGYLKAKLSKGSLNLELSVPDFEEIFQGLDSEAFAFHKNAEPWSESMFS